MAKVIDEGCDAYTTFGFRYLVGHGISDSDLQQILKFTRKISALPDSEKMEVWIGKSMGKSFRVNEPPGAQVHQRGLLPDIKEVCVSYGVQR